MSSRLYIGIDIAKSWLDISQNGEHRRINNDLADISQMIATLPPESLLVYRSLCKSLKTAIEMINCASIFENSYKIPLRIRNPVLDTGSIQFIGWLAYYGSRIKCGIMARRHQSRHIQGFTDISSPVTSLCIA